MCSGEEPEYGCNRRRRSVLKAIAGQGYETRAKEQRRDWWSLSRCFWRACISERTGYRESRAPGRSADNTSIRDVSPSSALFPRHAQFAGAKAALRGPARQTGDRSEPVSHPSTPRLCENGPGCFVDLASSAAPVPVAAASLVSLVASPSFIWFNAFACTFAASRARPTSIGVAACFPACPLALSSRRHRRAWLRLVVEHGLGPLPLSGLLDAAFPLVKTR